MPSPHKRVAAVAAQTARRSGALLKTVGKRAALALTNSLPSRKKDKKKKKPTVPEFCVVGVGALDRGQVKAVKRIGRLVEEPEKAHVLVVSSGIHLRSDPQVLQDLLVGVANATHLINFDLISALAHNLREIPSLDHPNVLARFDAPKFCPGPPTAGSKLNDYIVVLVETRSSPLLGQLGGARLVHIVEAHGGFSVVVSGVDGLKDPKVVHDLTYHLSGPVAKVLVVGGPRETAPVASRLKDLVDELRPSEALSDLMTDNIESVEAPEVCALTFLELTRVCLGRGREDLKPAPKMDLMTDAPEGASTARLDDRVGQRVEIREWGIIDGRDICDTSEGNVVAIIDPAVSGYVVQNGVGVTRNSRLVPTQLVAVKFTTGRLDGELLYFCEDDPILKAVETPQFDSDTWGSGGNAVAPAWNGSGASSTLYKVSSVVALDHAPHPVSDDWEPLPIGEGSSAISRVWRTFSSSLVTAARRLSGRRSSPAPVAPSQGDVIQEPCPAFIHSTARAPDQTSQLDVNAEVNQGIVEARKANRSRTEQRPMKKASGALLQQLGKSLARSGGKHIFIWNLDDNENARRYPSRKEAAKTEMAREGYVHGDDPFHESYLDALFGVKIKDKRRARHAKAWADRTSWRAAKNEADLPPDRKPWTDG